MRRRSLGAAALAVLLAASAGLAGEAPTTTCGQRFERTVAADPLTQELACAADPVAADHCIASATPATVALPSRGDEATRSYTLWVRTPGDAPGGTLRVDREPGAAVRLALPATAGAAWQSIGRIDIEARTERLSVVPDAAAGALDCVVLARSPDFVPDMRAVHRIDRVWSGVGVLFDAIADATALYVGYYDADRALAVAAFDRAARRWSHRRLDSIFDGWDNHNAIALAIDPERRLHVAGNMHASPLVYARMTRAHDLGSLALAAGMIGTDEARTTYPAWTRDADGRLVFLYRDGVSGAGRFLANRLDDGRWRRLPTEALFADRDAAGTVSAYPTEPVRGADGTVHLAWVWRRHANSANNFQIGYARTRDFIGWSTGDGRPIRLPIAPGDGDIVDDAPVGSGLFTAFPLALDAGGRPVVSYVKYDAAGRTQVWNARRTDGGWSIVPATAFTDRWEIAGQGSVIAAVRPFPVRPMPDGTLRQTVRHWRAGTVDVVLDGISLAPVDVAPPLRVLPRALLAPEMPHADFRVLALAARGAGDASAPFVLRWEAQALVGDKRPDCTTERPLACAPPPAALRIYERLR